ncbi:MAG: MFS transporter [Curvibacter sp.]|nr:MFS transporter [Curvibacter sp.]
MRVLRAWLPGPAGVVILAGVAAALHVAKLAPALPTLRESMGLSLAQAGWLLSTVQGAGMLLGAVMGGLADGWGLRRCMLTGLVLLTVSSTLAPFWPGIPAMLFLRALEGLGFLMATMPAAALVRRLVPGQRLPLMLGVWGTYMPWATALALLMGPVIIPWRGWAFWWWLAAALTGLMSRWVRAVVPPDPPVAVGRPGAAGPAMLDRLRRTWGSRGAWLVAAAFAVYSGQWLAVIGFLPSIVQQAGWSPASVAWVTACLAAVNMLGNLASGPLQARGVAPTRLLGCGYGVMALGAWLAFQEVWPLDLSARMGAVLLFSMVGGLIPGTLFAQAVRYAPDEDTVSTTVGWMQQCSSLGQFLSPPLAGLLAARVGGWQWTWALTGLCSLAGLLVSAALHRLPPRR